MGIRDLLVRRRRWLRGVASGIAAVATISVIVVSPAAAYATEICPITDTTEICDKTPFDPPPRSVDLQIEREAWDISATSALNRAQADAEQQCFLLSAAEGGHHTRAEQIYGHASYQGAFWKARVVVQCTYIVG